METFDYEDVQLIPNLCVVNSRSECDTKVRLGDHIFNLPVVPSNMATIINEDLALELAKRGYFYVMHRFKVDILAFVERAKSLGVISSISLGVKSKDWELVEKLASQNLIPDYITIDIAHGHAYSVQKMIGHIRKVMGNQVFVIAGNVGTPKGVRDLERWGADATKVGIGPGKVCITKLKTGFGTGGWQLSALKWCTKKATKPVIADGGIKVNGDIAKSIRFGASMVMVGSLLAAHEESPGKLITSKNGKTQMKEYFGSASEFNKDEKRYIEGRKTLIKVRGSIFNTLTEMTQDLQSSISYAGGKEVRDIRKVDYVLLKQNTNLNLVNE